MRATFLFLFLWWSSSPDDSSSSTMRGMARSRSSRKRERERERKEEIMRRLLKENIFKILRLKKMCFCDGCFVYITLSLAEASSLFIFFPSPHSLRLLVVVVFIRFCVLLRFLTPRIRRRGSLRGRSIFFDSVRCLLGLCSFTNLRLILRTIRYGVVVRAKTRLYARFALIETRFAA